MNSYSFIEWLAFFYIYCFLGWIIESTIVSFSQKRLVNRGFLKGPVLPIYGSGAVIILFFCLPFKSNIFLVYFVGLTSATILEYFTGWLMETVLKMRYWDYTNDKFNYKGRICLKSSLFWGVLSIVMTFVVHSFVEKLIPYVNNIYIITIAISIFFICDFSFSLLNVISLNKILFFLSDKKAEMDSLIEQIKLETTSSENITALKTKLSTLKNEYETKLKGMNFFHTQVLTSYPKAYSKKLNSSFKDLKAKFYTTLHKITKNDSDIFN